MILFSEDENWKQLNTDVEKGKVLQVSVPCVLNLAPSYLEKESSYSPLWVSSFIRQREKGELLTKGDENQGLLLGRWELQRKEESRVFSFTTWVGQVPQNSQKTARMALWAAHLQFIFIFLVVAFGAILINIIKHIC